VLDEIDWLLNALSGDDGVAELAAERDRLAEFILEDEHATGRQPIHGDASLSALLATTSGPRWNDFEDVCVGGVEWDVAGVLSDARAAHGDAFSAEVLAGYGRQCDPAALERVDEVQELYGGLWRRYHRRDAVGG
jgi:Ser/Thr protein kinase RdoA (MazF antagonist)